MGSATTTVERLGCCRPERCWLVAGTDASWPIIESKTAKNGTLPRGWTLTSTTRSQVSRGIVFAVKCKCCFFFKNMCSAINPTYACCNVL